MGNESEKAEAFGKRVIAAGGTLSPASDSEIAAVEEALGRPLPADLRALFGVTNGVERMSFGGAYRLATLDRLVAMWRLSMELADDANAESEIEGIGGAQGTYFVADWFPILDHGDSMFLAYDAAPAEDGVVGQLVMVDPTDDYRTVKSANLWAWLEKAPVASSS